MALANAPLLCPFIVASNIFTLKKGIAKTHSINVKLNVPDKAPQEVYQAALAKHWLVMGLKIDSSPANTWLSKMEAAIKNITCLAATGNFALN